MFFGFPVKLIKCRLCSFSFPPSNYQVIHDTASDKANTNFKLAKHTIYIFFIKNYKSNILIYWIKNVETIKLNVLYLNNLLKYFFYKLWFWLYTEPHKFYKTFLVLMIRN